MDKSKSLIGAQGVILETPERNIKGKFRDWALTIFQDKNDVPKFYSDITKYFLYGSEICPKSENHHFQCYIVFKYQKTFSGVKKLYPKAHIECVKGSPESNIRYCKKDGKWIDFGKAPAQGERGDLIEIKEDIISGKQTCEDIIIDNPILYHQYGRTFDKIEDIYLRKQYRKEMTKGIWYYGPTGCGKSHKAFENFNPDTHYNFPNDNGWWDGYRQQKIVIFNDFRGNIPYNELLQIVDKYPHNVKRRGREPMPFTSELVIITSSLHPSDVYINRNEKDSIKQLLRRFQIINLGNDDTDEE